MDKLIFVNSNGETVADTSCPVDRGVYPKEMPLVLQSTATNPTHKTLVCAEPSKVLVNVNADLGTDTTIVHLKKWQSFTISSRIYDLMMKHDVYRIFVNEDPLYSEAEMCFASSPDSRSTAFSSYLPGTFMTFTSRGRDIGWTFQVSKVAYFLSPNKTKSVHLIFLKEKFEN